MKILEGGELKVLDVYGYYDGPVTFTFWLGNEIRLARSASEGENNRWYRIDGIDLLLSQDQFDWSEAEY